MEGRREEVFEQKRTGVMGEELTDKLISIGPTNSPIFIGKASDAREFFTPYFDFVFDVWRKFKSGFGLPYGKNWIEQDQDLIESVLLMQEHYEAYYKHKPYLSRLDALLQRG